jgi:hypothetical protein
MLASVTENMNMSNPPDFVQGALNMLLAATPVVAIIRLLRTYIPARCAAHIDPMVALRFK